MQLRHCHCHLSLLQLQCAVCSDVPPSVPFCLRGFWFLVFVFFLICEGYSKGLCLGGFWGSILATVAFEGSYGGRVGLR